MTDEDCTEHFTWAELCRTDTGLPNDPDMAARQQLYTLCRTILEPIRAQFGAVIVHDGYRSPAVNSHPSIQGVSNSQHLTGEAADFVCGVDTLTNIFLWIIANLTFGQVILESKSHADGTVAHWLHVSLPRMDHPNYEALIGTDGVYEPYVPIAGACGTS